MFSRIKAYLLRRLCGHPRSHSLDKSALNSFVLLRYDRIGDLIVSLPLAKALKTQYPDATLALIASQSNAPVARQSRLFSDIYVKPTNTIKWIALLRALRGRFDVVVDLNHAVAPHAIFAILTINPKHVASPYKTGRWGVSGSELGLFNIMPNISNLKRPMAEIYLDIARELNCDTRGCLPYPLWGETEYHPKNPLVLLNHEGSGSRKRIDDNDLLDIARMAFAINPRIQIIATPVRSAYLQISELFKTSPNVEVLPPSDTILEVMKLARVASLIITPDTSLVHIACAFSRPLVAVYASHAEFYAQWRPINTAETCVIFSNHPIRLDHYPSQKLIDACHEMLTKIDSL